MAELLGMDRSYLSEIANGKKDPNLASNFAHCLELSGTSGKDHSSAELVSGETIGMRDVNHFTTCLWLNAAADLSSKRQQISFSMAGNGRV